MRIYCEIAPDYVGLDPGAVWEDTKVGFSHLRDWERAAMVTDVEWMRHEAKFLVVLWFLVSGEWRAFPTATPTKHASGLLAGVRRADVACPVSRDGPAPKNVARQYTLPAS